MRAAFTSMRISPRLPRLPLLGSIDLTYRCNNRCRHCWLWTDRGEGELSTDEILEIVDQARAMGCREWAISGGEPMLRPDFPEIFDHITARSRTYSLNTNGTLITPEIAELMTRKGSKMVAIYGATADVHDHITRHPGSFDATMRGFELLRDAGAGFTVQIVPMRDNYHQLARMEALARSLSPHWRIGASWLFLSASRDPERNAEIRTQRLSPRDAVRLVMPPLPRAGAEPAAAELTSCPPGRDQLLSTCMRTREEFHVDPYGQLSFCCFVKDPALRYDLRRGSFREGWEEFIPALAGTVHGGDEYRNACGSCPDRGGCSWCAVYGYLEHGRHGAKVEYLCELAGEKRAYQTELARDHRRFFEIGGITLQVDSDRPFTDATLDPAVEQFRADGPGPDTVRIHHHFELPDLGGGDPGEEVYRRPPWAIYRKGQSWFYVRMIPDEISDGLRTVAVFSDDHSTGRIYHDGPRVLEMGPSNAVTLLQTDQILLARLLADRNGCFLHSAGAVMNGGGLLFVGHSGAGKTTTLGMIEPCAEILSEDRNIVRHGDGGWQVYGSWIHSKMASTSPGPAPLHAILFLEQSAANRLTLMEEGLEIARRLLGCVVRPFVTSDWWEKTLTVIERLAREVPCYRMEFDTSGAIVRELERL